MIFRVIDRAAAKPIGDAEVRLPHVEPPQALRTDPAGICRIVLDEPLHENLGVYVQKTGFVPVRVVWNLGWRSSPLPADYTLTLEPATTIGGQVRDESNAPIEGVTVYLIIWAVTATDDAKVTTDILDSTATTDAEGKWHFDEAPLDLASLMFRLKRPGFVEELNFARPQLPPEQFRDRTVVWVMKKGVPVRGVVTDHQGRPLANAEVFPGRDRVGSGAMPSFQTDAAGSFSIPQLPGNHAYLTIKANGHAPTLLEFEVTEDMPPLRISMEPGHTIRGRIVDPAGAPVAGAVVFADTWRRHRTLEWMTHTGADGRFSWDCAPPDEVLFDFLQTGYQSRRRVPLTASEQEQTIVLRRPVWLRGAVTDAATGSPIEAFRIILGQIRGNHRIHWMRDLGVDFDGGTYERPFNPDAIDSAVWFLRVEAEGYRSAVSPIHDSGEAVTMDFHLDPGPPTTGRVHKPDGTPAENAAIAVVSGSSAVLVGGSLKAGHGNMELSASADGTFSFPPQEPPYAIVAAHETGCAIATAEQFVAEPVLWLRPWGRVEIIADGAAPNGDPIPFHLHYPDLPKDERRLPWVSIRPEPRRVAENRIVFEKLLPGRAALARSGQSPQHVVNILIEGSKTITLDFNRGIAAGEGKAPGAVPVKVIDESGKPVPGAKVMAGHFKLKSPRGSSRSASLSQSPPQERVTNSHGIAMIGVPLSFMDEKEVEAVHLLVRHPDFCPAHALAPVAGEALPIVLKHGATVTLAGFFETHGRVVDSIHAQAGAPDRDGEVDPNTWMPREGGALVNTQIPPGRKFLRLAAFPPGAPAQFSDVVEVNAEAGHALELQVALKPGEPFAGKLDDTVPRPVINGRVDARVYTDAESVDNPLQWQASACVEADGSFVFESLPPGRLELIALCDGHASQSPPAHSRRSPQTFPRDSAPAVVAMEPTATVRLNISDEQGKPLAAVRVHFNPNVTWRDRSSGIFGAAPVTTEQFLRMDPDAREKRIRAPSWTHPFHGDTDETGAVIIANLPAGKQHFAVFCQGYEMELLAPGRMMPGFREIDLRAGEMRTIALTMHKKEPA